MSGKVVHEALIFVCLKHLYTTLILGSTSDKRNTLVQRYIADTQVGLTGSEMSLVFVSNVFNNLNFYVTYINYIFIVKITNRRLLVNKYKYLMTQTTEYKKSTIIKYAKKYSKLNYRIVIIYHFVISTKTIW